MGLHRSIGSFFGAALAAAICLLASSCVPITTPSDMESMQTDINNLKKDSIQSKKTLKEMENKLASIQGSVNEMRTRALDLPKEESVSALRDSQTNLFSQVSELLREVQTLRGRFDESKFFVDKELKQHSADMELLKSKLEGAPGDSNLAKEYEDLKARLASIEKDIAILKGKLAAVELGMKAPPSPATAASPESIYDEALQIFNNGKYQEARQKWQAFLRSYPEHRLAGNAQFWIGETYYSQGDYDDAILSYEEVIQKHKDSPKISAAMLKQAYAFAQLGDAKAARGILKGLLEKYPDSEVAEAARKKLESLQ